MDDRLECGVYGVHDGCRIPHLNGFNRSINLVELILDVDNLLEAR